MFNWKNGKGFEKVEEIFINHDNILLINGVSLLVGSVEIKDTEFYHKEVIFKVGDIKVASIEFREHTKYRYATNEYDQLSILRIED